MKASILAPLLASLAMAQKVLDDQFAYHSSDGYYLNNNEWGRDSGKGRQCTYIDRIDKVGVGWHTEWSWSGEPGSVKSYPYSGRELAKKRTVNSIKSIHSKAEWMYRGTDVHANVAYDLFTAKDPDRDTSSGDYELMIWLGNLGGMHPIGTSCGHVDMAGYKWELFIGMNGKMKVFTFMAMEDIRVFESNIKPFFNHIAKKHGFPAKEQHLTTLQFGTEPFTGKDARFDVWYWMGDVN